MTVIQVSANRVVADCVYNEDGLAPQDAIAENAEMCGASAFWLVYSQLEPGMSTIVCSEHLNPALQMFWSNSDQSFNDLRVVNLVELATQVRIVHSLTQ